MRPLQILPFLAGMGTILLGLNSLHLADQPVANLQGESEGHFVENARIPGGHAGPYRLRYWSSWDGNDLNRGSLRWGPFPAPRELGLWICGYPQTGNNRLLLENADTGETYRVPIRNGGEQWRRTKIAVPAAWLGAPISIHAVDDADAWGGWLAISEPTLTPPWAGWWDGPWLALSNVMICGIAAAFFFTAAGVILRRWEAFRGPGALLTAAAFVAALGYIVFWIYFANALAGDVVVAAAFLTVLALCFGTYRKEAEDLWRDRDWQIPALLMVGAVALFTALLFLFDVERLLADLAANRYRENLPGDNDIPRFFADRLRAGLRPRPFFGDWLSSDRPPMQTGWILLLSPPARFPWSQPGDADHLAAFWFQALWIPATWWWLRSLGVTSRLATGLIAIVTPSGFYIIHSVFVWPKLGAGAFVIGAFTAWFIARSREPSSIAHHSVGGGLAGLAYVAHGGAGFSLLAAAPFALWRWRQRGWKHWRAAGVVFLAVVSPWVAYQKFYDPPGNRLLKWHLAGVIPPDERGTMETLVESYRDASWSELWRNRIHNVRALLGGTWRQLLTFDTNNPQARRDDEFFNTFFALGWWNVGFLAVTILAVARLRTRSPPENDRGFWLTGAWLAATLLIWVTLMFRGWSTVIHQGSYAVPILFFPLLALALWRLHPAALCAVAVAQYLTFPALWMSPPPAMAPLPMRWDAAAVVVASVAALLLVVLRSERTSRSPAPPSETEPAANR